MTDETETNLLDTEPLPIADETEGVDGAPADDPPEPELDEDGNPIIPDDAAASEAETEEVEHEGKKTKIPTWLKPALMMQADYTKKTQEVAEQRRTVDTQTQELATRQQSFTQAVQQHSEAQDKLVSARAELVSLDQNIAAYDHLIQQAEGQADYEQARRYRDLRQDLRDARTEAQSKVQQHQGELTEVQQRAQEEFSKQRQAGLETGIRTLSQDPSVKLTKPVFDTVASHLEQNFGIGSKELFDTLNDPRVFKVAKAYVDQSAEVAKLRAQVASLKKSDPALRPAETVRGKAPAGKDPDKMTTAEWMRREDEKEAAARKRRANGQFG